MCSTSLHLQRELNWSASHLFLTADVAVFSFIFHVRKQCAEAEMKPYFCVLAAFQHGRQVSGAGLGQHPYGGETPWTSGGTTANAPEKSGEPHHRSAALLPPPTALRCGPGVQRAFPHHPRGALVEEERYDMHTQTCKRISNILHISLVLSDP